MLRSIRLSLVIAGILFLIGSSNPVVSYPPFLKVAAKFGAKDCLFCHTVPEGGEGWNERGAWLKAEKEKRKAAMVDANWLSEYKPGTGAAAGTATAATSVTANSTSAKLTAEEKQKAIDLLKKAFDETLKSVEGLSEAQWTFKPAPDRWSVGETSEHILFFDAFLLGLVDRVMTTPVNPAWATQTEGRTEQMMTAVLNRSVKVQAPEPARPTGKLTKADFLKKFPEARDKTIKFVMENEQALKEHTINHPNLGAMNGYHWLLLIPLHNMRHNLQIEEVKATSGYPKS